MYIGFGMQGTSGIVYKFLRELVCRVVVVLYTKSLKCIFHVISPVTSKKKRKRKRQKNLKMSIIIEVKTNLDSERSDECIDFIIICFFFLYYVCTRKFYRTKGLHRSLQSYMFFGSESHIFDTLNSSFFDFLDTFCFTCVGKKLPKNVA